MVHKRCAVCRKKLKLIMPIACKCEKYYCHKHFFASDHNCTFDYIKEHQQVLALKNPKIIADKFERLSII